ncbi:hypothetical protein DRO37_04480 [Candidatus Bathyarchaeota archaeon]|nr:MAG: hypothetical protein DRO37_04480 [Candidatus Bathyarchaeota archaeon]
MRSEIYDYDERLERYRRIIKGLRNGGLALKFLDHLAALGLSVARASKYASHLPALLRVIDFDLADATREDVERVVAWVSLPLLRWEASSVRLVLYASSHICQFRGSQLPHPIELITLWAIDASSLGADATSSATWHTQNLPVTHLSLYRNSSPH